MKRVFAPFVTALMTVILFTGCTKNETSGTGLTLAEDSAGAAESVVLSPIEDVVDAEPVRDIAPVTVTFVPALEEDDMVVLEALTEEFNRTNAYGITVKLASGADEDTDEDAEEDADADDPADADIVLMEGEELLFYAEDIVPLDAFLKEDDIRYDDIIEAYRTEAERVGFVAGLPFAMYADVYYYNRSLFHEYELEEPGTWQALTGAGSALMEQRSLPVIAIPDAGNFFETMCLQNGADYLTGNTIGFDNDAGREAVRFFVNMTGLGFLRLTPDEEERLSDFRAQRTGGFVGSSRLSASLSDAAFDVGAVALPQGKSGMASPAGGEFLVMTAKDTNTQAACWEYIKYLTGSHVSANWAVATGYLPIRYTAYDAPEYVSFMSYDIASGACSLQKDAFFFAVNGDEESLDALIGRRLIEEINAGASAADVFDALTEEGERERP